MHRCRHAVAHKVLLVCCKGMHILCCCYFMDFYDRNCISCHNVNLFVLFIYSTSRGWKWKCGSVEVLKC